KPDAEPAEVRVAIIGHPNVGKSTLLNCLTASDRAIVSPIPGTTRDSVDEMVERNGRRFRFIDTAGNRGKGKTHLMAEKLSAAVGVVSGQTGRGTGRIFPVLEQVADERQKRISTSEMNRFLEQVDFERASVPMRQRVKILYMTQASVAPPTFVLFTNRAVKLHFSYQRFLENQIRDAFGFVGTPIWIKNRARNA